MKCLIAIALLALFAVVYADERPLEHEKLAPVAPAHADVPRDKRGVLLSYAAPYTYSAPITYSLPYAYRSYPYYYSSYSWV